MFTDRNVRGDGLRRVCDRKLMSEGMVMAGSGCICSFKYAPHDLFPQKKFTFRNGSPVLICSWDKHTHIINRYKTTYKGYLKNTRTAKKILSSTIPKERETSSVSSKVLSFMPEMPVYRRGIWDYNTTLNQKATCIAITGCVALVAVKYCHYQIRWIHEGKPGQCYPPLHNAHMGL